MPKVDRCELCGVDFLDGQDRARFIVEIAGICSGTRWTTMQFPELPVGKTIECHVGCGEGWDGLRSVDESETDRGQR